MWFHVGGWAIDFWWTENGKQMKCYPPAKWILWLKKFWALKPQYKPNFNTLLKKNFPFFLHAKRKMHPSPPVTVGARTDGQNHLKRCEDASKKLSKNLFWVTHSLVSEVADWFTKFTGDNEKPLASRCVCSLYLSIYQLGSSRVRTSLTNLTWIHNVLR